MIKENMVGFADEKIKRAFLDLNQGKRCRAAIMRVSESRI